MVKYLKVLSDPNRLRIFNLLLKQKFCVCELELLLNMSQSNVSRHLSKLKEANIIESSKDAQWVNYEISNTFKENNELLYRYLVEELANNEPFTKDMIVYRRYKELDINCKCINYNKEKVKNLIEGEDNE